ncbi:MAG: asparagine synthase (glutamine-hydrolyzing) [Pelagibacterales bacterium]|nr:asparagine synthase (glutamine-hydrolyzing) [Pelagibacterales bacterium]
MCGITGIISSSTKNLQQISLINEKLKKRGPDDMGIYQDENIALGHRRLSILDVKNGQQPMFSDDSNVVVVYNGEIYNFFDLRKELIKQGIDFTTNCDTEVILKGYLHWGLEELLSQIEGMFVFAIYDKKKEKLFIARDKFGEKPLYYKNDDGFFAFSSELKGLEPLIRVKTIDKKALNLFLSLSYIPSPYTIYENVKKMMPGTFLEINFNRDIKEKRYYDLLKIIKNIPKKNNFKNACDELRKLMIDSVRKRMISDVPIGSFLSGGLDSSIVSSIMSNISENPINTFSIGFKEESYDESLRAELVAKKIKSNHNVVTLDFDDVIKEIDSILEYYDEPFGDSSAIPSNYVAKLARKKVKVVLTGDCADELFGGYEKYLSEYYSNIFNKFPIAITNLFKEIVKNVPHNSFTNSILRRVKKVINVSNLTPFERYYQMMCLGMNDSDRNLLLNSNYHTEINNFILKRYSKFQDGDKLEKSFYTDLTTVLEGDMLVKIDRICMKNSLEARVPFLDSKIVEFAYSIPTFFKIKKRNKKYILKQTFKDLLPKKTLAFRKKGFGVPIDHWFKNELKEELVMLLDEKIIIEQGLFNYNIISKWLTEHFDGKQNHKEKLWNLFVFQKWYFNKMQK